MSFVFSMILMSAVVALTHEQNNIQTDNRLARKSNDFITGSSQTSNKGTCYDRCYDAYLSNRKDVTGCVCSQYDFYGRHVFQNCNCPIGTICEQTFGSRLCIPRGDIGGAIIGGGKYGSGPVPDHTGSQLKNKGHAYQCGQVVSNCKARSPGFNIDYKFTYDPKELTCKQILVYTTCVSSNIFDTLSDCARECDLS